MANRAYISLWVQDFTEATMLERYGAVLGTVPFSAQHPGIDGLVIRAVDSTETPLEEHDLRSAPATAEGCVELARAHEHFDCSYEARAHWDVWPAEPGASRRTALPIEIVCYGLEYDDGIAREMGHFRIDLGFDELFLGNESLPANEERLRENIRVVHEWLRRLQAALPMERYRVWSESEENLEAQLDAALAES